MTKIPEANNVGAVYVDFVLRNTIGKQMNNMASAASAQGANAFAKVGETAGNAMNAAMNRSFSKSFAMAERNAARMAQIYQEADAKVEQILFAKKNELSEFYKNKSDLATAVEKSLPYDKIYQKATASADAAYAKMEKARDKLAVEAQAASAKQAAAEEAAAQRIVTAQAKTEAAMQRSVTMMPGAFERIGKVGQSAFGKVGGALKNMVSHLGKAGAQTSSFNSRLKSIVSGALIFNGIAAALRRMTSYFSNAITSSAQMRSALANLQGAAASAASPIIQILTPALAALANAAAVVFSYIARLFSLLTGKSMSVSAAAKGISGFGRAAGGAAKQVKALNKANNQLGIDELNILQPEEPAGGGGGGGGGGGELLPNYDFSGTSPFLDSLMEAIKAGDYYGLGALMADKINESLDAIDWAPIQEKASRWAKNIADTLNGLVEKLDWNLLGSTLANGLNTAVNFIDTFFQTFHWASLGQGLGRALNSIFTTVDWPGLGRTLSDKFMAIFETLHGFLQTFNWESFGAAIARLLGGALSNINWTQAVQDLSLIANGLVQAISAALAAVDWSCVKDTIVQALSAIDWSSAIGGIIGFTAALALLDVAEKAAGAIGILAGAFTGLKTTGFLAAAFPGLASLGAGIAALSPIILGVGAVIAGVILILDAWKAHAEELNAKWSEVMQSVQQTAQNLYNTVLAPIIANLKRIFDELWSNHLKPLWDEVLALVASVIACIMDFWNNVLSPVVNWVISTFGPGFSNTFNLICAAVSENIAIILDIVCGLLKAFRGVIEFLFGVFTGDWQKAWNGIKNIFGGVFDGIYAIAKGVINNIISLLNGMIGGFERGLNSVISGVNSVLRMFKADKGLEMFGLSGQLGQVGFGRIPMLANGGVIDQPTLAMMGEYRGAKSNPEIAAPQSVLRETFEQSLAPLLQAVRTLADSSQPAAAPLAVYLDGEKIYENQKKVAHRRGYSVVANPALL
ncbi:MAG: hypothetical protein RSF73_02975 [Ruthenibacterium sp.]